MYDEMREMPVKRYYFAFLTCVFVLCSVIYIKNLVENKIVLAENAPKAQVIVKNKSYSVYMGSYCWRGLENESKCVNSLGAVKLAKKKKIISVHPGEKVELNIISHLEPNETSLYLINGTKEKNIVLKEDTFTAPLKKGTYYYTFGAWWDADNNIMSYGNIFYVFALTVT